jgi:glycosyltransferase involved in cell wall biosynthesis
MRIAFIGTRGIPAQHGGFETCVEEVGLRLTQKGHHVTVYSKRSKDTRCYHYKGMINVYIPRVQIKGFETLFASFLAVIHSLFYRFDMHMIFDSANSPLLYIYKIFEKPCAINTDGLGWKRDKWGKFAKKYYKLSEWIAVKASKNIVTDSRAMQKYYETEYNANSTVISYGANIPMRYSAEEEDVVLAKMGIDRKRYFLQITRFEPENNPDISLKAFNNCSPEMKMVLIGGVKSRTQYLQNIEIETVKNSNIVLPGFIYDRKQLDIIWTNCFCYIHGNFLGGTNPALLQAMASGRPVVAVDCVFNREVLDGQGFFYNRDVQSLREQMRYIMNHVPEAEKMAHGALERVKMNYNWDLVASKYEELFKSILTS